MSWPITLSECEVNGFSQVSGGKLQKSWFSFLRARPGPLAPLGYEDETGFHYGPEPEPGEAETSRNVDLN